MSLHPSVNYHRVPPLLPTVCLCAIVKDEADNPSGGIQMYINRILSYVHSAVIVDTGSNDATRTILHSAQSQYTHLHVYDAPFESFGQARNESLRRCYELQQEQMEAYAKAGESTQAKPAQQTAPSSSSSCLLPPFRHLLVLDADEELTLPVLELIAELLQMDEQTKRLSHSAHSSTAAAAVVDPNVDPSLFALKFSCHCFDSSGMGAPRSNSGLWNPRIFTLLPGLSFKNLVDNYRFERLYYQDLPIPTSAYLKERDLTPELLHRYTKLIVHANEAHTNGGDGPAASSSASSSSSSNGTTTTASTSSSASSNHNSFSHSLNDLNDFTLPDYLHGDDAGGHLDDSDVSIHPSILIPMRHYIPSVKERRRKNKRYKAGLATTTTTANTNVPLDLDTLSIAGGGGVTHSESTSIQPTRMTPQKSRIFPAASAQI